VKRPRTRPLAIALGLAVVVVVVAVWMWLRTPPPITGTWSNGTPGDVTFVFNPDGTGSLMLGTNRLPYRYEFDRSQRPMWLDLHATPPEGQPVTIRAIVEFPARDRMKVRMFHRTPTTRPTEFDERDIEDTILVRRQGATP